MKSTTIFFLLLTMPFLIYGQTTIKGFVSDDIGTLSGANIIIKNSDKGTVSNIDGYYEIKAKRNDTLSVSYLGYNTEDILVANQENINITLVGSIELDEVNIIGYGTTCCTYKRGCQFTYTIECFFNKENIEATKKTSSLITQTLYPNPSKNGHFQLKLLNDYKNIQIQVANISGQIVKMYNYKSINKKVNVDLSQFPKGIYIINIIADGKRLAAKKAIIG